MSVGEMSVGQKVVDQNTYQSMNRHDHFMNVSINFLSAKCLSVKWNSTKIRRTLAPTVNKREASGIEKSSFGPTYFVNILK